MSVNLEGIQLHEDLLKALIDYKQSKVLDNNYYTVKSRHSKELIAQLKTHHGLDAGRVVENAMIQKVAAELYPKVVPQIKEVDLGEDVEYSLEFILIRSHELKHIVDYCVRHMPSKALEEIRNKS
jgi:hypothetical protein